LTVLYYKKLKKGNECKRKIVHTYL